MCLLFRIDLLRLLQIVLLIRQIEVFLRGIVAHRHLNMFFSCASDNFGIRGINKLDIETSSLGFNFLELLIAESPV